MYTKLKRMPRHYIHRLYKRYNEIVLECKDETFKHIRELQVRIFSLIPALLLICTNKINNLR
jgi:hypothetical protein